MHGGHGHFHSHDHNHEGVTEHAPWAISKAILITFIFMLLELVGGWYSNSLALISDGAHMLTDIGAMLVSLFAIWIARKPSNSSMSFGYHRAEILGALISGLIIWLISGLLVYEAIVRLQSPPEVQGPVVFVIASLGLIANLFSMRMLHPAKQENINVRAAYLHLVADSLGSVGAVLAGLILWLTGWRLVDPMVTILFAGLMLFSSWTLIKEAVEILMESTPSRVNSGEVHRSLSRLDGVREVHDLHIWSVSTGKLALSVHLISEDESRCLLASANQILKEEYGIIHTTIQIEHPSQFASDRCYDCSPAELRRIK